MVAACSAKGSRDMGWRILLVDDDPLLREVLAEIFSAEGHAVYEAGHGGQALELLARGCRPGIILLDIMMPVMDGFVFLERKNADPAIAAIPVVVISATERRLPPGAAALVAKPFEPSELEEAIARHHAPLEPTG